MTEFFIGQTFKGIYPPEAAIWCNESNALIEKSADIFVIQARTKTAEELAKEIRQKRNAHLSESDKYMMPDYPITEEKKDEWKAYRQALRDITLRTDFPYQIDFPGKP